MGGQSPVRRPDQHENLSGRQCAAGHPAGIIASRGTQFRAGEEIAKQVDSVAALAESNKHEVGTVVNDLSGNLNSAVEAL